MSIYYTYIPCARVSSRRGARAHAGIGHGVAGAAKPRTRYVPSRPAAPAGGDVTGAAAF